MRKARRVVWLVLRFGVSVGLIAIMLSRLELRQMSGFFFRANLALLGVTLATVIVDRFLMAARWVYLLEALGVHAPRGRVVKIFFLSTFFGSFLPSGIGGDAVRTVAFSRLSTRLPESVASVAMDRLLGMLSMFLTALVSLGLFSRLVRQPALLVTAIVVSLLTLTGLAVLLSPFLSGRALSLARLAGDEGWRGALKRTVEAFGRYRGHLGALALVLVFSMGVQVLRVFQAYFLSESMGLATPLVYFFCFVPIILIITMLPISVSGWGTTNLAYVALFGRVGMDPEGAFVLSALILALGIVGNLPGGLIYAAEGFRLTPELER